VARGLEPAPLSPSVSEVDCVIDGGPSPDWLATATFTPAAADAGLEHAEAVLIAGRGAGSRAGVDRLARVADRLGMAFAVSRPVTMNAWAPCDRLAGVSGAMLKPRLCVLAGVSGAPALMAAVTRARTLVAINTDPAAPVFRLVDVGIVGDCLSLLEAFADRLLPEAPS
jgi:electron transfer flavoprotein alpha subunit